jgi:hypothetical protein
LKVQFFNSYDQDLIMFFPRNGEALASASMMHIALRVDGVESRFSQSSHLRHLRQWCGQVPELPSLETKIAPKREVMCLAAWCCSQLQVI